MSEPTQDAIVDFMNRQGGYLIRYWQEFDGPYRYMLKPVAGGEREMFQDLPTLLARLSDLLQAAGVDLTNKET